MKKQTTELIKETIFAKYTFTFEEIIELSRKLGRTCNEINELECQKSAVAKEFSSRIETREIERDKLIDRVTLGHEMRETDCIVILDPPNRSKDYFRMNPDGTRGDFVVRKEMTAADFELELPMAK